jgi:hypothetical protein
MDKFYSADITIPIVEIYAKSGEEAEAIIQRFIDKVALIMEDELRWDDADWVIQENIITKEGWVSNDL